MSVIRQMALLPAGCQPWHPNIVAVHGTNFAYAATLAIYVYKLKQEKHFFRLHSIIAHHKQSITCLAWHPTLSQVLASGSTDPSILVWDVEKQCPLAQLDHPPVVPQLLAWHPEGALMFLEARGPFQLWHYDNNNHLTTLKEMAQFSSPVTQVAWHPTLPGRLAVGHEDGSLSFFLKGHKAQRHHLRCGGDGEGGAIGGLAWDPLSPNYLLASCRRRSEIFLVDTSKEAPVLVSTYLAPSQAVALACVAWVSQAPGTFISGDADSGVLRIWNVSKSSPQENLRLKQTGFQALAIMPLPQEKPKLAQRLSKFNDNTPEFRQASQKALVVCLFLDGGLGVYNLHRRKWDYFRDMGHIETIFDCQFNPDNSDLLATSSFDGTVKVWNITTMEPEQTSPGNESVIYAISWSPGSINCIAGATSKNGVIIWSLEKSTITQRITSHGKAAVYSVAWNQKDSRKIASAGGDATCRIHQLDGTLLHTFPHPSTVYGCDWHPKNENILATACEDKAVRIFYVGMNNTQMLKMLTGHTAKVFRVRWSPLKDGILCSGSDDTTIRVWDYTTGGNAVHTLEGHTGNVRGLAWSPELPQLLLSGSWDHTIRLWDVSAGTCLDVLSDHGADVYGLACHPHRPFLFASSSRDSTVRLWSLQSFISTLYINVLTNKSLGNIFATPEEVKCTPPAPLLCGQTSRNLKSFVVTLPEEAARLRFQHYSLFFSPLPGVSNLWDLVAVILGLDPSPTYGGQAGGIVHQRDILKYLRSEAQQLELVRGGIVRREEQMREAAFHHLLAGNIQRYCEVKVDLGEWQDALAVAPGVSLEYWRSLALRRGQLLASEDNSQAVPLLAATGSCEELVEFFQRCGRPEMAYTAAVACLQGALPPWISTSEGRGTPNPHRQPVTPADSNFLVESVAKRAEYFLQNGSPVRAACSFMSIDGIEGALAMLLRGNELELLASICLVLEETESPRLGCCLSYLAWRCVLHKLWDLAMDILELSPHVQTTRVHICAHCPLDLRDALLTRSQLPSTADCLTSAQDLQAQESSFTMEVVKFYLLSLDALTGLRLGLKYLQGVFSQENWELDSTWEMIQLLSATETHVILENEKEGLEVQIYAAYLGALMSVRRGFRPITDLLFNHALNLIGQLGEEHILPLSSDTLNQEMESWRLTHSGGRLNPEQLLAYDTLLRRVGQPSREGDVGTVWVSGSHLPHHSDARNCFLRHTPIQGPVYLLDDGQSTISLNDALMWAKVNPFSPLGTGCRICPF